LTNVKLGFYPVLDIEQVATQTHVLRLEAPEIAETASAGQFVMVRTGLPVETGGGLLLKRPFSLYRLGPQGSISLLFRVVGSGTKWLSHVRPGELIEVLGPLGRGFAVDCRSSEAYLVAGGMGIAPVAALSESLPAHIRQTLFYGIRTQMDMVKGVHLTLPVETVITTEDGTCGQAGLITDALEDALTARKAPIFACGPKAMLSVLADLAARFDVPAQVSLEAHMACGMGACLGCVVAAAGGGYLRVCAEGPVFDAGEVSW
jgi:dihydroorotate dehydrogenase electron transfer subunit